MIIKVTEVVSVAFLLAMDLQHCLDVRFEYYHNVD
ncbi:hypothetical protein IMAU40088_00411 [Lactobacillus helveticus]|uniref:Uncharacterized protein n=1 Tax=Lactobacillus helveticus TaxID=1587 RepID=A0A3S8SDN4_LACHE|nr:hypothetical protein LH5_01684 [Lactobacillus helveticus]NRO49820.1 hypothetical protein [Lactobacillus helveticus]NRO63747.1 hypothetical protein [Lactobacillus helveticus]NRO69757.1 hypothetical protein [Lactobacillus helveticus]